ncbi:MAG: hypothetical protein DHS20C05_06700 [Hyphococcus sp.]|nr:MAG: hypothetical protein DHS20C05_06700 [Marinicaulis sp.]
MADGFFQPRRKSVAEYEAGELSCLRENSSNLRAACNSAELNKAESFIDAPEQAVVAAERQLLSIVVAASAIMHGFTETRNSNFTAYRYMQWLHGVVRNARKPDALDTILLAMVFTLLEGGFTAVMMIADGKMTLIEGVSYGMIFAVVTIVVGLFAGYFPGRHLLYRLGSPDPTPADTVIRAGAWAWFLILVLGLVVLIFNAARVRALGGHEHIFDYSEVSFLGTFDDAIAIIIIAIGLISSMLAIWKGICGLSDPIPGYTQARREAEDVVNDNAEASTESAIDSAYGVADPLLNDLGQRIGIVTDAQRNAPTEIADLNSRIAIHNDNVQSRKERLKAKVERACQTKALIKGEKCGCPPTINEAAFDALIVLPIAIDGAGIDVLQTRLETLRGLSERLIAARENAVAELRGAYADFLSSAPTLDVFPEIGDFNA